LLSGSFFALNPTWKHPFTALISGLVGCGNPVFVRRFIQHLTKMVDPDPEEIIWCCGEWQPLYEMLKGIKFIESLLDVTVWEGDTKRLVIIDDLMSVTDGGFQPRGDYIVL
jgi:hypothetical protein